MVPLKFTNNYDTKLSDSVKFKQYMGKPWQIGLTKVGGRIWFDFGWSVFLNFHNVKVGYTLHFRFLGDDTFYVWVCDENNVVQDTEVVKKLVRLVTPK